MSSHCILFRRDGVDDLPADASGNKTIAWKLGVSRHTAKFHVASSLLKLGAGTRTEAVTIGVRRGLVPL